MVALSATVFKSDCGHGCTSGCAVPESKSELAGLTDENEVELGALRVDRGLLGAAAGESARRGLNKRAVALLLPQAPGEERP